MVVVRISIATILETILHNLGLPATTFDEQENDGPIFTCTIYYPYADNQGNIFVSFMVGVNSSSIQEAKNNSCMAAIDHLKAIYDLEVIDYNHRELAISKMRTEPVNEDFQALSCAYNDLSGQFTSLLRKYKKLKKALRKIKSSVVGVNYLL